ncbi:MAG TPA: cytochrome c [Candidatus Krumholzibacteria bacterium]|nr:cytochrome c [Candidatus Krumholzibacteria bacterium]
MRTAREHSASGARPRWGLVFTWVVLLSALALAAWSLVIGIVTPDPAGAASEAGKKVSATGTAPDDSESARLNEINRALALIEYVIGDYPTAVSGEGEILDSAEYEEQRAVISEVRDILAPDPRQAVSMLRGSSTVREPVDLMLLRNMASVQRLVSRNAPSTEVQEALRTLWRDVVEVYDLRLSPEEPPSVSQGGEFYTESCAVCHAGDGRGRTDLALHLDPPPADLLEARFDETLTPARVFNAITFGIPGTAMPSYEVLDESERWDLAFFVLALRQGEARELGNCVAVGGDGSGEDMWPSIDELAGLSDAALAYWLQEAGVTDECVDLYRAKLRWQIEP